MYELYSKKYEYFRYSEEATYLTVYYNYISAAFRAGKLDLLKDLLNESKTIRLRSASIKLSFFQKLTSNWLSYYLNTGKLDEASNLEIEFNTFYNIHQSKIDEIDLLSIFYNFSLIYFFNCRYDKCLDWLAKLDNLKQNQRKDIFSDAKIIQIICHYELSNFSLLQSLGRSKTRRKDTYKIESEIVKTILKSTKNKATDSILFLELSNKLDLLEPTHKHIDRTTVNIWIQSKLEYKSLTEIYLKEVNA